MHCASVTTWAPRLMHKSSRGFTRSDADQEKPDKINRIHMIVFCMLLIVSIVSYES